MVERFVLGFSWQLVERIFEREQESSTALLPTILAARVGHDCGKRGPAITVALAHRRLFAPTVCTCKDVCLLLAV